MSIQSIVTVAILLCTLVFSGIVLLSKTTFESMFMTSEQILKKRLFDIFGITIYFSLLIPFFYVMWKFIVFDLSFSSIDWSTCVLIGISTFLITFIFLLFYAKPLRNFIVKEKIVYKVKIEDLGELYIIKMLDKETCICSFNAHTNLDDLKDQIYLIKIDNLIKTPITRESITIPVQSFYKKLLT